MYGCSRGKFIFEYNFNERNLRYWYNIDRHQSNERTFHSKCVVCINIHNFTKILK